MSHPDDDPAPREPLPPDESACCGNGCDPCVFDFYAAEREQYLAELHAWQVRHPATSGDSDG
ncbi:MAG TPA: oxidoreductase-like domain-containing protein [Burkholderiaceae bacterium]|nr:oxidoreductase-like domain-containing protein [Burkholderiaceae bacterium]